MKKNIFIALSILLCVPVHANNPESAHVTQLIKHVANADFVKFKRQYAAAITTPEEQSNLLRVATEHRSHMTHELTTMNRANRSMKLYPLAKGVGQLYLALLSTLGAVVATAIYSNLLVKNHIFQTTSQKATALDKITQEAIAKILKHKSVILAMLVYLPLMSFLDHADFTDNKKTSAALFAVPTLAALCTACYCGTAGISNISQGWNYTAYLETQIKNLDAIIELLQGKKQSIELIRSQTGEEVA